MLERLGVKIIGKELVGCRHAVVHLIVSKHGLVLREAISEEAALPFNES